MKIHQNPLCLLHDGFLYRKRRKEKSLSNPRAACPPAGGSYHMYMIYVSLTAPSVHHTLTNDVLAQRKKIEATISMDFLKLFQLS